jgi:transcriptional regulator with XRE-family HTH domain
MEGSKSRGKEMQNVVTDAVRRLRRALGETQQQFAARTGLAISTVVRYELSRPPRGEAIRQFKDLAAQNGLNDIAATFAYALGEAPEAFLKADQDAIDKRIQEAVDAECEVCAMIADAESHCHEIPGIRNKSCGCAWCAAAAKIAAKIRARGEK